MAHRTSNSTRAGYFMKQLLDSSVAVLLACLLSTCASTQQVDAFREAGSPINSKATLHIGYNVQSVEVDGQKVTSTHGFGTAEWIVEMLPGRHEVKALWKSDSDKKLSGHFDAENGRHYAILTDTTKFPWDGVTLTTLSRAYIVVVELPIGNKRVFNGLGNSEPDSDKALKNNKIVCDLHPID